MRKHVAAMIVVATVAVVAAGVAYKRRRDRQWKQTQRILRRFARECATPVSKLWEVANSLVSAMEDSLNSKENSTLHMLVSYVSSLPHGNEKGLYYGLNLRDTSFLILCARLGGRNEPLSDLHRVEINIPSEILSGTSQELFDFMAVEVAKFDSEHSGNDEKGDAGTEKKLGFTLSYPVDQDVATTGSAIKWKRFSADDPVGNALVNDMNQSLKKVGLNMHVFSLVADITGNLAGGKYYDLETVAAVTLGSGTNAVYSESTEEIDRRNASSVPKSGEMVISTEWYNFNCSHFPVTEFDAGLDSESLNPGTRIYEKLTSALYLGEIVRRVLLKVAQETALFGEDVPAKLSVPYVLSSPDMAAMHQDISEDQEVVSDKLREIFGITYCTPTARKFVVEVCDIVAERGARLAGAGIVGIIKKLERIEKKRSVVVVEGCLYEHYRIYRNYLHSSVWEMLGNELSDNVIVENCHGGSGAGAIFLASCQSEDQKS
ncbi:hypothetical protein K2173_014777 [Erythroxylum novogranatense]|uniref:Phosphotransferase n=1 Tax=Erythroxylum novogranatense TaxID=1862640 RepID=A0AAV8TFN0_9ROSI|nr:hypothetical protein K2173_014777 [Erythroxylum novogranatense]